MKHFRWIEKERDFYLFMYFFTLQPSVGQTLIGMPPSTNIEERNRAKTQSAVVFILLTQAPVHEKFWYI